MTVLSSLIDIYHDPMFLKLPVASLALGIAGFLLFSLPWTLLAIRDPAWARPYRIQDKPFDALRYLPETIRRMTVNTLVVAGLLVLAWPLLRLSGIHDGPRPAWYVFVWQIVFFVFLDDFLYYWMHRWMHENKWLLRHVHAVHHQVRNPCALAGNHFHWAELAMTSGLVLVGPILVGAHVEVVYLWVLLRQLEAADGHTGYHFPWDPLHRLPFYEGAAFHDFHHARFQGNYAGFLPLWDRIFGTYVPQYLHWRQRHIGEGGLVPPPPGEAKATPGR